MAATGLSDSELRKELKKYKVDVGPITATTRSLYIKKLNHLLAANKKATTKNGRPSRQLIGFSSDESDSERSSKTKGKAIKGRKSTSAVSVKSSMPRNESSLVRHKSTHDTDQTEVKTVRHTRSSKVGLTQSLTKYLRNSNSPDEDDFDVSVSDETLMKLNSDDPDGFNSSDSDSEIVEVATMGTNTSPTIEGSFNRTYSRNDSTNYGSPGDSYLGLSGRVSRRRQSGVLGQDSPTTSTPDRRRSLQTFKQYDQDKGDYAKLGSNSVSNKTKTMTFTGSKKQYTYTSAEKSGNNVRGQSSNSVKEKVQRKMAAFGRYDDSTMMSADEEDAMKKELDVEFNFNTKGEPWRWTHHISIALQLLTALFFVAIAVYYVIYIKNGGIEMDRMSGRDNLLFCEKAIPETNTPQKNCFKREDVKIASDAIHVLYDELSSTAGDVLCGYKTRYNNGTMSREDTRQFLNFKNETTLQIVFELILHNPHWNIRAFGPEGKETSRVEQIYYLESSAPYQSLLCRFKRALASVTYQLTVAFLAVLIVISIVGMATLYFKWNRRSTEKFKDNVYELVEKIIDILQDQYNDCQINPKLDPYIAIPHVRDMLIVPQDRKKMQLIWDKAVEFLASNESRIRVETQHIQGEEFEVWRWIQDYPKSTQNNRVWQGQAFGECSKTLNNIPTQAPTPCLKIRNLFDSELEYGDAWPMKIQDAILEKCSDNNGIVHVAVDKDSKEGCVFVKCLSNSHAGDAFKALHGWWFDGNLVTVKYLRLERYHQRFPDAKYAIKPLTPSDTKKQSTSKPFHRSVLEIS